MNRKIGWANLNKHTLEEISASTHRVFMPQANHQTHQLYNTGKTETKFFALIKRIKPISFPSIGK
jgi:hypothetical protein